MPMLVVIFNMTFPIGNLFQYVIAVIPTPEKT